MQEVQWASWIQAGIMLAAILVAPGVVVSSYRYLVSRMDADCTALFWDSESTSRFWAIAIKSRSVRIRRAKILIYSVVPGNFVQSVIAETANDGAIFAVIEELEGGCVELDVRRIVRGRELVLTVTFAESTIPSLHSDDTPLRQRFVIHEGKFLEFKVPGSVAHYRLMILLLQFVLGTAVIALRLGYLALPSLR
jgi:hypothetical protein